MTALSIDNLRKTYRNGFEALKGINLTVEAGDFYALLGPNGAGKSTVISVIASLITKSSGQVSIYGHDLDSERETAKRLIGLVPQEFNFNMWEPVEEILINQAGYYGIPRKLAYERAETYLKQLNLWDKRQSQARWLSGGMKRRLMIARALVHQPQLLILDEPTAGVDIEIRRSMWKFLREINQQGTTIILTTHYLEEAESLCRNIAIIDHGQIIEQTSMAKLLSQLNTEIFVLNLDRPLEVVPDVPGYTVSLQDGRTLEVEVLREQSMNDLFSQLSQQGISVVSMRNKQNRLEQLFIDLVGRSSGSVSS
ncbi:MAG: ABC transporter ATP-binding protein [Candidatus Thiodiazotropha sp. (ex Notomyrtea botanica)]|nr:ABC transporter ATP-binding protein [Candidatus Thiodiazotropha sp. (ex Notomyrtea botanica)]